MATPVPLKCIALYIASSYVFGYFALLKIEQEASEFAPKEYTTANGDERALTEISLGGLLILVGIRTVQYNMLKIRDKYLHTNCLAALANMSAQFRELHTYVSQRLISLFETLAKKYLRLVKRLKSEESQKDKGVAITVNQDFTDLELDISDLEEVLKFYML